MTDPPARGELWSVAGGVYTGKPRPALIIQDEAFAELKSTTVLPLTTTERDAPLIRFLVEPGPDNGLRQRSWIMIDKITTVRAQNLGTRIGALTDREIREVERLLLVFLGMGR